MVNTMKTDKLGLDWVYIKLKDNFTNKGPSCSELAIYAVHRPIYCV